MVKIASSVNKSKTTRRPTSAMASNGSGLPIGKRRFLPRPRPATSVVVTVTFVTIFTIIITMEVIVMDEARRNAGVIVSEDLANYRDSIAWMERETADQNMVIPPNKEWTSANGQYTNVNNIFNIPTSTDNEKAAFNVASGNGSWFSANYTSANTSDDWQPVFGGKEKFYVYSAYLDSRRRTGYVRVIGATRTRSNEKVHCIFWYHDTRTPPKPVSGSIKVIRENWNLKYSAIFVLCPLDTMRHIRSTPKSVPDEVSIVVIGSNNQPEIGNRLPVLNRNYSASNLSSTIDSGFAVCVKPLHYNFNRAVQLMEFIELNRILGVSHFTFYNHTIGHDTACVLRHYVQEGVVTLLPWQLDILSQKEIRTEGLFAAINDCVYRYMYRYRYLLMIDIDEFIVPHRNFTLISMVEEFDKKIDPNRVGSLSFMNAFFYLQWPNDVIARDLPVTLITLQKTKRKAKMHPHKQRSKCIIAPSYVVEMGNHFVWEFLPGKGAVNVPPDVAFLHHYRVCEFGGDDCVKTQSVTDRTLYLYRNSLVQRVMERINSTSQSYVESDCKGFNASNMT